MPASAKAFLENTILHGDCVENLSALPAESVDLIFADPPFNIGYKYDVYDDSLECDQYLAWSKEWITGAYRVLKPNGTFWLAIGDEYAAELKIASEQIGFHCRSWVIWYYTFGVNCAQKFTRSHAHLFYFVKDPSEFKFRADDPANRIPSARQLVYNDKRANPKGRLPDDTWITRPSDVVGELSAGEDPLALTATTLPADDDRTWVLRPQDISHCFQESEDTWYFPRVAGTFKERAGFHGCQMPEQLLGRIIKACSESGDLVVDPFSGSATTLAVAKKLGRRHLGFDLSEEYVRYGQQRLESIRTGDPLDGSPEPLVSAPQTKRGRKSKATTTSDAQDAAAQLRMTLDGILQAFGETHDGFSADRLVTDPELNSQFAEACKNQGIVGEPRTWNTLLFRLRKAGELAEFETSQRTAVSWHDCDNYLFASELAWQSLITDDAATSLDEILCDPTLATEFDKRAGQFAPGFTPFQYRWAALKIRKEAKSARARAAALLPPKRLSKTVPIAELASTQFPEAAGLYLVKATGSKRLYAGWTLNLQARLSTQFAAAPLQVWQQLSPELGVQTYVPDSAPAELPSWQCCLIQKHRPTLNLAELAAS